MEHLTVWSFKWIYCYTLYILLRYYSSSVALVWKCPFQQQARQGWETVEPPQIIVPLKTLSDEPDNASWHSEVNVPHESQVSSKETGHSGRWRWWLLPWRKTSPIASPLGEEEEPPQEVGSLSHTIHLNADAVLRYAKHCCKCSRPAETISLRLTLNVLKGLKV